MQKKIARFCAVGAMGTIFDISLLLLFVETFGWPVIFSNSLSFSATMVLSFFAHRTWTFKNQDPKTVTQFLAYFAVSVIGLALSNLLIFAMVAYGIWYLYAKIITVIIITFWSFFANYLLTFGKS